MGGEKSILLGFNIAFACNKVQVQCFNSLIPFACIKEEKYELRINFDNKR